MALKRAREAVRSGALTRNPLFALAIWTCAAAGAALNDELGTFRALVLSAAKLFQYILDELLLLLLAIQSRVETVGQREVPKLVNLSLRLEGSFNR